MPRSSPAGETVNHITVAELKQLLGPQFENAIRRGFSDFFSELGLVVAEALIQGEVDALCGPKNARSSDRAAVRWGSQPGSIRLKAAKEAIRKPRVRSRDGSQEIELETYTALNREWDLVEQAISLVGAGVSTRDYARVMGRAVKKAGLSKSSVSRHVIVATKNALEIFLQRRWDQHNFVAILIDGVRLGTVQAVAAVGVDKAGRKHVLGWNRGPSENFIVCRDLIRDLIERGLHVDTPYLFVLDGSKALAQAVRNTFGDSVHIQRCQEHKIRDVEGYLPHGLKKTYRIKLQAAYNETTYNRASQRLQSVRRELLNISEKAANALCEGLEATLTLHRLGIAGGVRESLRTTNIIESTFARMRYSSRNVTNWKNDDQVDRWLAFTLLKCEAGYKRVRGYRQLAKLAAKVAVNTASQSRGQ